MLQKEDLKEAIAEVLETMVGKNLLKEPLKLHLPSITPVTSCAPVCTSPIPHCGARKSVATSMSIRLADATCILSRKWMH